MVNKEFNLTEEKKEALEKAKFKENSNCSYCYDCSYCSNCYDCSNCSNCSGKKYMIKNVQFTKGGI